MRFSDTKLLWTVENVYSEAECAEMVQKIEHWAPTLATNNPGYRNQDRVIRDEPEFAQDLFTRIKHALPEKIGELTLAGLNERIRFYRYQPGQRFSPHMDHWYQPSDTEITLLTVLVYFNDDFEGGDTRFVEQIESNVKPAPGLVALFQHKIRHEGAEVLSGTKYAARSDVLYKAPFPIEKTFEGQA